ncbi:translation initiation factor IF-2 [Roseobacter sp. SK209-2-6]|nr:hypothetical protein [Roseobacter sp. SK209-2-6]EBA16954.1 translation initiation factor IF-2 [Roseobacter sp. SK209-2-6]
MLRTIIVSKYITVQGTFVQALPNGRIAVRIGKKIFKGQPISAFG